MKTKKIISDVLIISAALILYSCKDNIIEPKEDIPEPIFPLAVGNQWICRTDYYFNSAGFVTDTISGFKFDTTWVVRDSMISNERWYAIKNSADDENHFIGQNFYINKSEGLFRLSLQQQSGSYRYPTIDLIIKRYMNVGDSIVFDGNAITKLVAKSDSIIVEGTKYICSVYKNYMLPIPGIVEKDRYYLQYLSPKIGSCRVDYIYDNKLATQSNLISYKLY